MTSMDDANKKFIDLYTSGVPVDEIAKAMGWSTTHPKQMVQAKRSRLIKRGYDIPPRSGRSFEPTAMTRDQAQDRLDAVVRALGSDGFSVTIIAGRAQVIRK
jgi:hypothetical protein